ncbi:MAG: hypothetical protein E7324_08600 [Clostridiales bacterium]|nr:hypothetical protein [Clostridiales bacterium]
MKKLIVSLLLLCLCILPALADDSLSLPDGRTLRLEPILLGQQFRAEEANTEDIYMLNLYNGEGLFQQLYFTTLESREEGPFIKAQDLNFDGYPDLDIIYLLGASNSQHIFFFFDQETGRYAPWPYSYRWLSNFTADAEKKVIINYIHDSAMTGTKEIYRWEGKKLQLVRKGDIIWDETDPDILVLRIAQTDPEWGELTVIHTRSQDVNTASEAEILSMHQERDTLLFEGLE